MCAPALPLIAAIASVAGTGVAAYGSYKQADAANKAAEYNAQIAENNAALAERQAQDIEAIGKQDESKMRKDLIRLKGSQRAAMAATGALVDTGSAADLSADTTKWGEVDAMTFKRNVAKEAWAARAQKTDLQNQARLQRMQRMNPYLGATGTLLSGIGSGLSTYRSTMKTT